MVGVKIMMDWCFLSPFALVDWGIMEWEQGLGTAQWFYHDNHRFIHVKLFLFRSIQTLVWRIAMPTIWQHASVEFGVSKCRREIRQFLLLCWTCSDVTLLLLSLVQASITIRYQGMQDFSLLPRSCIHKIIDLAGYIASGTYVQSSSSGLLFPQRRYCILWVVESSFSARVEICSIRYHSFQSEYTKDTQLCQDTLGRSIRCRSMFQSCLFGTVHCMPVQISPSAFEELQRSAPGDRVSTILLLFGGVQQYINARTFRFVWI